MGGWGGGWVAGWTRFWLTEVQMIFTLRFSSGFISRDSSIRLPPVLDLFFILCGSFCVSASLPHTQTHTHTYPLCYFQTSLKSSIALDVWWKKTPLTVTIYFYVLTHTLKSGLAKNNQFLCACVCVCACACLRVCFTDVLREEGARRSAEVSSLITCWQIS